jgi:hypothetical protein
MSKSLRRHEGYLLIDNRGAPDVPALPHPRKRFFGVSGLFESATITCAHCHAVVVLNPQRTRERGYCRKCDHYVCDNPGCNVGCTPMNKILDEAQEAAALQEQRGSIILPSK